MSFLPKSAYIYLINSDVGFGKKQTADFLFSVDGISGTLLQYHDMKDHSLKEKDKA